MHTYINFTLLNSQKASIERDFNSKKPFRYVVIENFFAPEKAEEILACYPSVNEGTWDTTTYINQKNKFQSAIAAHPVLKAVFAELNSQELCHYLTQISHTETPLLPDEQLFGAGLHQSVAGAFLNVHIDYNIHPKTAYHRRLNLLVYMNKNWQPQYEGHLELWDFTNGKKELLEKIAPEFNRCVIFETNEISYHGHPKPLNTPKGESRKSLAVYYYTPTRPQTEIAPNHNTRFVNTEGISGQFKKLLSGVKALWERLAN
ncbi:MAG: 2OG-Fe(II) oxygenase [Chitinophagales bacterium]|nr:2OG-Fe(II) oxygenase [Chitinophagales bacterium]